jgi:hypothetical protein
LCYYTSEMACPYFYPVERHTGILGPQSAILPLGDAWSGVCRAAPGPSRQPEEAQLLPLCYFGYARGRCDRFPTSDTGPDAVRFTISSDDGASLGIYYVQERDHHPFAHGPLQYSLAGNRFFPQLADETFARQAEAYVQSYLLRRTEAFER